MKVLCLWYATEDEVNYIRGAMPPSAEVIAPKGDYLSRFDCAYSDAKDLAADADAMIGFSVPEGLLEIAEKLKVFSWLHSGVDDLRQMGALSLFKQRGVKLANVRGANAVAVAEQAMMFVLALAKRALLKHQLLQDRNKPFPLYANESRSAMLHGRTIGIIGVGNIGARIAKHAKGFDMHVLGVRRNKEKLVDYVDSMHGMDELHVVLAKSDYVVLAMPATPETNQFFGKVEIQAMKSSAFLVNVSRGNLTQEKPLYEALTSGGLRGYAADVWWSYGFGRAFPAGSGSRLRIHELPNVIGSDGQAANADDVLQRNIQWGTYSLMEFTTGKPLTREVSLDLGY
ncbi:NAD(P)-dependent oxidoreductase [Bradyrhizobium arachidis]|uniref:Phosphoglycerate dehydrogenase n=1 Tax=Bradyrhizobium arachidis TaxID=858423 RepID=A0AAE7NQ62_9BRAD|nr:NAD(P)-dependent oxidoreductase [Bradyrhizobium arachidis]QOZ66634.1 phosphoglycerate dehydrogenase [Bradyrhizobium arachidis]SFV17435.1 Phosphoglycerate dehydrogenase [Bradyrhizobium arachidis]